MIYAAADRDLVAPEAQPDLLPSNRGRDRVEFAELSVCDSTAIADA